MTDAICGVIAFLAVLGVLWAYGFESVDWEDKP